MALFATDKKIVHYTKHNSVNLVRIIIPKHAHLKYMGDNKLSYSLVTGSAFVLLLNIPILVH